MLRLLTRPAWCGEDRSRARQHVTSRDARLTRCRAGVVVVRQLWASPGSPDHGRGQAHPSGEGEAEEERFEAQPGRGGDVAGSQRRDRDGAVTSGFTAIYAGPRCAGPARSIFMITVVDRSCLGLTPSSTLATRISFTWGSSTADRDRDDPWPATGPARPYRSHSAPATRSRDALVAEGDDERQRRHKREVEDLLGEQRKQGARPSMPPTAHSPRRAG